MSCYLWHYVIGCLPLCSVPLKCQCWGFSFHTTSLCVKKLPHTHPHHHHHTHPCDPGMKVYQADDKGTGAWMVLSKTLTHHLVTHPWAGWSVSAVERRLTSHSVRQIASVSTPSRLCESSFTGSQVVCRSGWATFLHLFLLPLRIYLVLSSRSYPLHTAETKWFWLENTHPKHIWANTQWALTICQALC